MTWKQRVSDQGRDWLIFSSETHGDLHGTRGNMRPSRWIIYLSDGPMDLATAVSVASAVAALLSALYAANSARSARRSADLAQNEAEERGRGLSAYLVDAVSWTGDDQREFVAIGFTLTNLASLPNTATRTELALHGRAEEGESIRIVLSAAEHANPRDRSLPLVGLPLNLSPRATESGWLAFMLPPGFSKRNMIDKYELVFHDSTGRRTTIETHVMREIVHA